MLPGLLPFPGDFLLYSFYAWSRSKKSSAGAGTRCLSLIPRDSTASPALGIETAHAINDSLLSFLSCLYQWSGNPSNQQTNPANCLQTLILFLDLFGRFQDDRTSQGSLMMREVLSFLSHLLHLVKEVSKETSGRRWRR